MPANVTASIEIMTVNVVRAFFHSGGLKAGTPSDIASTPVMAAQPELNARRMTNRPMRAGPGQFVALPRAPVPASKPFIAVATMPTPIMTTMPSRKR